MKFSVAKSDLDKVVARAERIAGKHLSLPVLKCLLFIAQGKELVVRATNLDLAFEARIPADVSKEGVIALPADTLGSFLTTTQSGESITFSLEESSVLITTAKSRIKMRTMNHEDFPILPARPDDGVITVKASEFALGLRSVSFAASPSSIKPELGSVYVYADGSELVFVATDSFRLAEKKIQGKIKDGFEGVLIPLKNVPELTKHIEASNGTVTIVSDGHQIGIDNDGIYLSSRILDGVFPDYRQILPKEYETEVIVLKQDMVDALKQSRIFSDTFNKVSARFDEKDKTITLATVNPDTGESVITLDAAITGETLELNFNYAYWADSLQAIKTDSIAIELAGVGKPARIRSVGDQSFMYIVMPMNR